MHKQYVRIVKHAEIAILFIHGIVGTPNHFNQFLTLVPDDVSVYNVLLDGHGKGAKEFAQTSMKKWREQISLIVRSLEKDHKEIYVVAHSMGCLLAVEQAVVSPKITKMFLLAAPLKVFVKPKAITSAIRLYFGKIDPDDAVMLAMQACSGVAYDKNIFLYFGWIPRFLELLSQISRTRKIVKLINVPTVAFQSQNDELVARGAGFVLAENPMITVSVLKNSGHYFYDPKDILLLNEVFVEFLLNTEG